MAFIQERNRRTRETIPKAKTKAETKEKTRNHHIREIAGIYLFLSFFPIFLSLCLFLFLYFSLCSFFLFPPLFFSFLLKNETAVRGKLPQRRKWRKRNRRGRKRMLKQKKNMRNRRICEFFSSKLGIAVLS